MLEVLCGCGWRAHSQRCEVLMRCIERGRHMEELAASLLWMSRLAAFLQFPTGLPSLGLQKKGIPESWFFYIFSSFGVRGDGGGDSKVLSFSLSELIFGFLAYILGDA